MKIKDNVLISVDNSDIDKNGVITLPDNVTEIAHNCFYKLQKLKKVIGKNVTQCGNDCFWGNAALTSISLPVLTQCGNYCFWDNAALTSIRLNKYKLVTKFVDGYPYIIESEKTSKGIKIYNGYNFISMDKKVIKKENCYVAEKDNYFAHGESVKKAVADLQFKLIAEKLKKEPIKANTIITVQYYRIITGACEMGCKSWMQQNNIKKESYKAGELLPLLEKTNAYGLENFKKLITF